MRCVRPIRASYGLDGNISFSRQSASLELGGFAFGCRKCLACRLNTAREKAIRAFHEAQMYENNIFLTLTYDDEHLKSPKLNYLDFQLFMKSLRKHITKDIHCPENRKLLKIGYMVTGEYGDKTKRPHWHVLIFNYRPHDETFLRSTERGDRVYNSPTLTRIWGQGNLEFGDLTLDSANYVARYAAKKLSHGNDQDHDFHPIHRTSCVHAIGKKWIEKNWKHTFENGFVVLPNGSPAAIPRFYKDWLKEHQFDAYLRYVTEVLPKTIELAEQTARKEEIDFFSNIASQSFGAEWPKTKVQVKETILKSKFKRLQEFLKL